MIADYYAPLIYNAEQILNMVPSYLSVIRNLSSDFTSKAKFISNESFVRWMPFYWLSGRYVSNWIATIQTSYTVSNVDTAGYGEYKQVFTTESIKYKNEPLSGQGFGEYSNFVPAFYADNKFMDGILDAVSSMTANLYRKCDDSTDFKNIEVVNFERSPDDAWGSYIAWGAKESAENDCRNRLREFHVKSVSVDVSRQTMQITKGLIPVYVLAYQYYPEVRSYVFANGAMNWWSHYCMPLAVEEKGFFKTTKSKLKRLLAI